jgi:hypothetical protein
MRATGATASPPAPTRWVTHVLAPAAVSHGRGPVQRDRPVQAGAGHLGSGQRQIRCHHGTVAGPASRGTCCKPN